MISYRSSLRTAAASAILAAAAVGTFALAPATAQNLAEKAPPPPPPVAAAEAAPTDLTKLPPLPKYAPPKTAWGDPDFRGMWPTDNLGGLPMQRTAAQGNRVFLTEEEYQTREKAMDRSRNAATAETNANKLGMGNWVEMTGAGRRTSLLIDPPNGRLPDLTEKAKTMNAAGRSSWKQGQTFDWTGDFDSWDRCVTRGFPASMMPFRYNNGQRIFQSPGFVVIDLEMIHDSRVIPIDKVGMAKPSKVKSYMGESHGHWEGNTLVIETTNIRPGAAPINMATIGGLPNNTLPMGENAQVVERMTLTGPNTLVYEMTYKDSEMWTAPWTVRLDWQRNSKYEFFEYACHEGNVQFRNYIVASRAQREKDRQAAANPGAAQPAAAQPAGRPGAAGGGQ